MLDIFIIFDDVSIIFDDVSCNNRSGEDLLLTNSTILLLSEIIDDLEVIGDHFCANWYISGGKWCKRNMELVPENVCGQRKENSKILNSKEKTAVSRCG